MDIIILILVSVMAIGFFGGMLGAAILNLISEKVNEKRNKR